MKVTVNFERMGVRTVHVTLSERNLRDLLAAYEDGALDLRTEAALVRRDDHGESPLCDTAATTIRIAVEDDDTHYAARDAGPGYGHT